MRIFFCLLALAPIVVSAQGSFADCLKSQGAAPGTPEHRDAVIRCDAQVNGKRVPAPKLTARLRLAMCLQKKAAELDDGISPASDVSKVIVPACEQHTLAYARLLDPSLKSLDGETRRKLTEVPALSAVLETRASQRKKLQESDAPGRGRHIPQ